MSSKEENVSTPPEPETIEVREPQVSPDGVHTKPTATHSKGILTLAVAVAALALVIYTGIHSRAVAESRLKQRTEEAAIPAVIVVFPRQGAPTNEIMLPGIT